ncbi:MAG: NTP transferase domain-containing protein [Kordiimonadaceae bacterium]|nr:NTP transferase domain-containing protein [Kordiimonadaceae bacterium]
MIEDLLIVAAGMGTRLRAKGDLKPLVDLCGKPLIEHALEVAFASGLKRATVVVGYNADVLTRALKKLAARRSWDIETVYNPDFKHPNGISVLKAQPRLKGRFILAMCDHLVEPKLYDYMVKAPLADAQVGLGIDMRLDNEYVDLEDVTRVRFHGRHILDIGKEIPVYNAFDTGIFSAGPALFEAIEKSGTDTGNYSISGGMHMLAENKNAIGINVEDSFWIDVDSPEMHRLATGWLSPTRTEAVG